MQTVAASTILDDAYRLIDWDPDQLEDRQKEMARSALSLAVQEVWQAWWWEEVMKVQTVKFAASYQGILLPNIPYGWFYSTGDATYFPPTDAYYVNLWPAGPPALQVGESYQDYSYNSGPDAATPVTAITDNLYGWAKYKGCDTPQPPLWNRGLNPALGDQVTWDGNIFQWIRNQGDAANTQPDPAATYPAVGVNPGWMLVKPWQPTLPFTLATPNLNSPYNSVITTAGLSGDIHMVCRLDPRTTAGGKRYHQRKADNASGIAVLGLDIGFPWVSQRRPVPIITGDDFDSTISYAATPSQDLIWDN